jgi:hydrogenase maturation protein HypF
LAFLQARLDLVKRKKILIAGQVQGVGFRPAVYRLACELGLTGFVYNDTKGVTIELQGEDEKIAEFLARLQSRDRPPLAQIKSCKVIDVPVIEVEDKFVIGVSATDGSALSQVTADIATCQDCLAELNDEKDFRYGYPFINCTNCGPRYSIVKTIPYDRPNTTMSVFKMCDRCAAQYKDVTDRRFHAQPVACVACGPKIWLTDRKGKTIKTGTDNVIAEAARLLRLGKIVAIKGVGGFHLAVDALNDKAVRRLRQRKRRDHKPFAMMADSIEKIRKYAIVSESADRLLKSPQAPIVLLPRKKDSAIAPAVAEEVDSLGFMLCYAPLHYLLFERGLEVLVMTSGNISDEPLICKNEKALERLGCIADAFLMHDREIYRQVDDSVVHFIDDKPVPLRRARGYVPTPIFISRASCVMRDASEVKQETQYAIRNTHYEIISPRDIFAAGADMKNTFCFVKQNQLICSEHIGDLEDVEVYHHYIDSVEHLRKLFEVEPKVVVCDLHPGYLSTQYALSIPNVKVIQVQHHWAHIASVLVEHALVGPVIGIECDGTGYGIDGVIWGCECMIASLEKFERFGHLAYYDLAGADKASKEAVRPLLSLLKKAYGSEFALQKFDWLLQRIESGSNENSKLKTQNCPERSRGNLKLILEQIEKRINTVKTSSLGRVFDAIAAMLGLGSYNHFDAQLPMAIEAIAACDVNDHYELEAYSPPGEGHQFGLDATIRQIVSDIKKGVDTSIISAKFHNTIVEILLGFAVICRSETNLNTVALSGGVFCNRYLTNRLIKQLRENGFCVLFNREVPANDGGLSIGQAAIASYLVSRIS